MNTQLIVSSKCPSFSRSANENDISLEDVIYRFDSDISIANINSFKQYYLMLYGSELSMFTNKTKQNLLSIYNLNGTFVSQGECLAKGKDIFYSIIITYSKTMYLKFYFISQLKRDKWLYLLHKLTGFHHLQSIMN